MNTITSYRDLVVWKKAMQLAKISYLLTREFPKQEEYRISSQIIRASISIPANIAERFMRRTRKDYRHFVSIVRGSAAELETLFMISIDLNFADTRAVSDALELNEEISKMLNSLHKRLGVQT